MSARSEVRGTAGRTDATAEKAREAKATMTAKERILKTKNVRM